MPADPIATLTALTGDLATGPNTPPGALEEARLAVATAIVSGQQVEVAVRAGGTAPPVDATTRDALTAVLTKARQGTPQPQRVARRDMPGVVSPSPAGGPAPYAGRIPRASHGPFVDAFGRNAWIDVFDVLPFVGIQRGGSTAPAIYVAATGATGMADHISLGAGSVWVDATALTTGAPAGSYVGLRITSGTVAFGSTIAIGGSPIIVPANATLTVTLALDPATATGGSGPGADARAAHVTVPATVTLTLAPAGAMLTVAGGASVTAFGATAHLIFQPVSPVYDQLLGRVAFPFQCDATAISIGSSLSTLVAVAGTAPVTGASWSLPVTPSAPADLGSAAGAGGVALSLAAGLTAQWRDRDLTIACGPCEILVDGGTLIVASGAASAPNRAQTIALWAATSSVIRFPSAFPLRFVAEAVGVEAFAVIVTQSATFDRPRTVNNDRVRLDGNAVVMLAATSAGTTLIIDATAPSAQSTVVSYAIKNLLIKASDPIAFVLTGAYANGAVVSGTVALQFELRLLVPILPDPYAGNIAFDPRAKTSSGTLGVLSMVMHWQKGTTLTIDLLLPANATARTTPLAAGAAASAAPLRLLDLSTNISQFGVAFNAPSASIADLFLQVPGFDVEVMTLPAVQWEPVITPDRSTLFPSPLTYADSGIPTTLVANSVALVPVAPRPAIDALLAAYNGTPASAVSIRFTLPFGIVATAQFERARVVIQPSVRLSEVVPQFTEQHLMGGDQLSIRAEPSLIVVSDESPSLPGSAEQLQNARSGGLPTPTTVLTVRPSPNEPPIDDTFNKNFAPGSPNPRIPVTRLDISGFGESAFSDWRNHRDAAGIISKAQFDVIVGRTSREVIMVYSVLYPYAVRVVRTITIERQNGGVVARHDSGWQAVSDGEYAYPKPDLITHPGLVRGVVKVTNIRDTGQTYTTSNGSALMAVRFDCAVTMENAIAGAGPAGVPARGQLGYVQLTDPPQHGSLAPDQYAELIAAVGTMGGPVDCIVDIGGTGQRIRVAHVGIGAGPGIGGPEFVMAAWGSPIMPGGGQWSFLVQPAGADAPQAVDSDLGVPVVRAGPVTLPPPVTSPYRFANPADALRPDSPAAEYGIVHATGTQRVLFPRPKIEATGAHAITSVRAPVIADPYGLGTALGPFPPIDACIPFPDHNYALAIGAGGNLVLQRPTPSFTTPPLKRVLASGQTDRAIVYCADENNTPSVVTLTIDTAASVPWALTITNVSAATESDPYGEVARLVGTISSAAGAPTRLTNARYVFGPALAPVARLINFLEQFGPIPSPTFAMTNQLQVQAGTQFALKDLLEAQPAAATLIEQYVVDLDYKFLWQEQGGDSSFVALMEETLKWPLHPPIYGVGLGKVQFQTSTKTGRVWNVQLGAGGGFFTNWHGLDTYVYGVDTVFAIVGPFPLRVGASRLVKGDIDFKFVEGSFSAEAKATLVRTECAAGHSIFIVGQFTVALEITVAWFIDIQFQYQWQCSLNTNGGPCPLPPNL